MHWQWEAGNVNGDYQYVYICKNPVYLRFVHLTTCMFHLTLKTISE